MQGLTAWLENYNRGPFTYIYPFRGPDVFPSLFARTFSINDGISITGKLISELVLDGKTDVALESFNLNRFSTDTTQS